MITAGPISAYASTLEVLFALDGLCGFLPASVILGVHEVRHFFALRKFLVKVDELTGNLALAFHQLSLYKNERLFFGLFSILLRLELFFLILGRGLFIFGYFFFFNHNLGGLCNILFYRLKRWLWLLDWQLEFLCLEI